MNTLEERLKQRKKDYETLVRQEHFLEEIYEKLSHLVERDYLRASVHDTAIHIYIHPSGIDFTELTLIPALSDIFEAKWDKRILDSSIVYTTVIRKEGKSTIFFNISPNIEGTCQFLKIPTGRVHKVRKQIEVDEPEYEIVMDCGEETLDV